MDYDYENRKIFFTDVIRYSLYEYDLNSKQVKHIVKRDNFTGSIFNSKLLNN